MNIPDIEVKIKSRKQISQKEIRYLSDLCKPLSILTTTAEHIRAMEDIRYRAETGGILSWDQIDLLLTEAKLCNRTNDGFDDIATPTLKPFSTFNFPSGGWGNLVPPLPLPTPTVYGAPYQPTTPPLGVSPSITPGFSHFVCNICNNIIDGKVDHDRCIDLMDKP